MGKQLDECKRLLYFPFNYLLLKRKKCVACSGYPTIRGLINIHGHGTFKFGKNVCINSSRNSNPIGGDSKTILATLSPEAVISIGDNTGISNSAICAKQEVIIGSDVTIGGSCKIYDNDFHPLDIMDRLRGGGVEQSLSKPVHICNGVFIGACTIILKGTYIGQNSIVGAGSVVPGTIIPDNQLWAGNPARKIRDL